MQFEKALIDDRLSVSKHSLWKHMVRKLKAFEGTVMKIEKALVNDRLSVSKHSL